MVEELRSVCARARCARLIDTLLLSSFFFFNFGFLSWFRTVFRLLLIKLLLYTQSAVLCNVMGLAFRDR